MKDGLFRKKSLDRISSPEELNDYIKVASPGVWMIISAVMILLAGVCVWGIFGRLETRLTVGAVCENGVLSCYVKQADIESVRTGMIVKAGNESSEVSEISPRPIAVGGDTDEYVKYAGELRDGEWVYIVNAAVPLEDGAYEASIITESTAPISFITN